MPITIRLINQPTASAAPTGAVTFGVEGGTIGRAESNHWVLPDPERYVSSQHAAVFFENGAFHLRDTSVNGVYLNDGAEPIGKGESVQLAEGDRLQMGDFEMLVSIEQEGAVGPPGAASFQDPLATGPAPPGWAPSPPAPLGPSVLDEETLDPLAALDASPPEGLGGAPLDPLAPSAVAGDQSASLDHHFSPPDPNSGAIPDDWANADLSPPAPSSAQGASPVGGESSPSEPLPEDWWKTHYQVPSQAPAPAPPAPAVGHAPPRPQAPPPTAPPAPAPEPHSPLGEPPGSAGAPTSEAPPAGAPAVPPPPTPPEMPSPPTAGTSAGDAAALQALLAGAGLPPTALTAEHTQALMHSVGGILREVVQGLMEVLAARTSLKNELRIPVTMITQQHNNPLKFSVGVDDALNNLLLSPRPGFMPPLDAFQDGFEDVRAHQLAMMAGMQAAFFSMLKRLSPEQLEEQFSSRSGGLSVLPGQRKGRFWDLYRELYEEHAKDTDEAFKRLFGEEFVRAYEEQMVAFERARQNQRY